MRKAGDEGVHAMGGGKKRQEEDHNKGLHFASLAFKDCEILLLLATFAFICCRCCFACVCRRISERVGGYNSYGEEFVGFVSGPLFPNHLLHYNTYTILSAEGP